MGIDPFQSATVTCQSLRQGALSSRELTAFLLSRVSALNPLLNAFLSVDAEGALRAAAQADEARSLGEQLGPLHGLPVSVKDVLDVIGQPTSFGTTLWDASPATSEDVAVARMRAAGAIVIGKTNTPEFSFGASTENDLCGPTRNPYDPTLSTAGSSGGAAVAVATGLSYLALGTDYGGSVRTPAAFCGVVGFRPSVGAVPIVSRALPGDTFAVCGPLARSVEDVELLFRVIAGPDSRDPISIARYIEGRGRTFTKQEMSELRIAYSLDLGIAAIDHGVRKSFEASVSAIRQLPASLREDSPDCSNAQSAFETIRAAYTWENLSRHLASPRLSHSVRWNIEAGKNVTISEFMQAQREQLLLQRRFVEFFEQYDFLVTPASSVPPFPIGTVTVDSINATPTRNIIDYLTITYVFSLAGCPAIVLPAGMSEGMPVAVQVVGPPFSDFHLLAFAQRLQDELRFRFVAPRMQRFAAH
jgi:amidase